MLKVYVKNILVHVFFNAVFKTKFLFFPYKYKHYRKMNSSNLKESFDVESKHEAFYTGGNIEWSKDGEHLFCQNKDFISIVSISKGTVVTLGKTKDNENEDTINSFTLSKDGELILTHHKSSLFKLWNTNELKLLKIWKSFHNGPVSAVALTNDALGMASGGVDGSVRLWDLRYHACTHNLKGTQGVVGIISYNSNIKKSIVFASADDYIIHGWNVQTGLKEISLEGHFSKVTSLSFHEDGIHAVSSGRDKVLILWDLYRNISLRILPVYESIEGAFIIPNTADLPISKIESNLSIYVASAGEHGLVKIWEMQSGCMLFQQRNSLILSAKEKNGLAVKHLVYNKQINCIGLISTTHNILIYTLNKFECKKQLIGYIDEILDITYLGRNDSYLAVATNTSDIKLYELATMNCQLLCGHTNIILSLASSQANPNLLLSSDKDNCVRLWLMDEETKVMNCIGLGTRHSAAVGCIALSQVESKFFVSVSQDCCLKIWNLPNNLLYTDTEKSLNVVNTVMAHQKGINSVAVSPNDKLIATGSQDKTAKLWSTEHLQQLGVLHGHRRGVWCVRFSPIDQVLATSSADCTIKLWSLSELTCLKTFEGHESAVLKIEFLSRGMQIISSGADGLLKLWNIKSSEYISTLDQHNSRVWSLAVSKDETHFVSGGSDSLLIIWKDTTQEKKTKLSLLQKELALDEQKLTNFLKAEQLTKALKLALKLQKPMHVLHVIEALVKKDEDLTAIICDLKPLHLEELLKCAIIWNTNARNFQLAQLIINVILNEIGVENLQVNDLKEKLESIIPYTERHFKRLTQVYQDLHLLTYTINSMKSHNSIHKSTEM